MFADGAYDRTKLTDKAALPRLTVEIVRRSDAAKGFEVIPRRWLVGRTFACMTPVGTGRISMPWMQYIQTNKFTDSSSYCIAHCLKAHTPCFPAHVSSILLQLLHS